MWKGGEGGCGQRGQPAKGQSPAWAGVLGDVTHDGAADRSRPQEGDCPQGHYPSAHGLVRGHLQHGVPAGHEADAAGADHRQGEHFGGQCGRRGGNQHGESEGARGHGQAPMPIAAVK